MSAIYLHIPFCKQACHYCDFHFSTRRDKQRPMVLAMVRELGMRRDEVAGEAVDTIYFGGGTPSLLSGVEIDMLLNTISRDFRMGDHPEITLEANPDDLSDEMLRMLRDAGINRLSIGIQSFHDRDLKFMNRAHDAAMAVTSLEQALGYFENISVDLIYGIPGLSAAAWESNFRRAAGYGIPHISSYALTVEPGTALAGFIEKKIVPPLDDELAEVHFRQLVAFLSGRGYVHYELSNFGKPGFFSRNNTAYWQGKPYLGIGPSAHSYDGRSRKWNVRNNPKYLRALEAGELPYEEEVLTRKDRYNEYVMTGLRTIWGVSVQHVRSHFGLNYYEYLLQQASRHLDRGYLYLDQDTLGVTDNGKFLSDGIASDLFMVGRE